MIEANYIKRAFVQSSNMLQNLTTTDNQTINIHIRQLNYSKQQKTVVHNIIINYQIKIHKYKNKTHLQNTLKKYNCKIQLQKSQTHSPWLWAV